MKLTAKYVEKVKPTGKRQDIPHDDPKALVLRLSPSGAKSWAVRYSFRGRDVRYDLGPCNWDGEHEGRTLAQARTAALEILTRVGRGENPQAQRKAEQLPPPGSPVTVAGICKEALAHLQVRENTRKQYSIVVKAHIEPKLGKLPAETVTRRDLRLWAEGIAASTPVAANRAFAILKRFWAVAVDRDLVPSSPFTNLRRPAKEQSSERVLSIGELWALQRALEEMREDHADVVWLLLYTGVRLQNVLQATKGEFDLDAHDPRWTLSSDRMKAKRPHVVPLSKQALELVKRRPGPYLFPWRSINGWGWAGRADVKDRLEKLLPDPVPNWTIHGLRRTIATHMREAIGVRRDVVSLILSHNLPGVTSVYDRAPLLADRREALQRWADWLEALPKPGKVLRWKEQA